MKRIYFTTFIICLCSNADAQITLYPHNYIINNTVLSNNSSPFYYPTKIISPGVSQAATINGTKDVEFVAGEEVILKDGFDAENFTSGQFIARTEPIQLYVLQSNYVSLVSNVVHVKKWEKFECAFALPKEYEEAIDRFIDHYYDNIPNNTDPLNDLNPYAGDSLKVTVSFTSANGTQEKTCFFMREAKWAGGSNPAHDKLEADTDHELNKYRWHFRFAPDEVQSGWAFTIHISAAFTNSPFADYEYKGFSFTCDNPEADNKGYLKLNPNNSRYLKFDNGDPFFGMGHNIGDQRHYNGDYDQFGWFQYYRLDFDNVIHALDNLNSAGANYVRLMLFKSMYDFEWHNLGVYDDFGNVPTVCTGTQNQFTNIPGNHQYQLRTLDLIFDRARADDIYLQLNICPIQQGADWESWAWGDNAYVRRFTDYPGAYTNFDKYFFDTTIPNPTTNPDGAFYWWKRRYKYLDARYGYSTNLATYESFNEVGGSLGYYGSVNPPGLCTSNINTPSSSVAKDAVNLWHENMFNYIRDPVSQGGLGQGNHLLFSSFQNHGVLYPTPDNNCFNLPYDCGLYENVKDNLLDIHDYDFHLNTQTDQGFPPTRFNFSNGDLDNYNGGVSVCSGANPSYSTVIGTYPEGYNTRTGFSIPPRPFHHGETGTFCMVNVSTTGGTDNQVAYRFYNNYEIPFHQEIWSSAMMGHFTTSLSFFYETIHRWPGAEKFPTPQAGQDFQILGNTFTEYYTNGQPFLSDQIRTLYHHYKRLSEFLNNSITGIDFTIEYVPHKYFNLNDRIESYYLVDPSANYAYGWVRNLNYCWFNEYYYDNAQANNFEHLGCQNATTSPPTSFSIEGLLATELYYVEFYPTVLGSYPLPFSYTASSNSSGELVIDFTNEPLGCDSTNGDYAFSVFLNTAPRFANTNNNIPLQPEIKKKDVPEIEFLIKPNPSNGKILVIMPASVYEKAELTILDVTGRVVFKQANILTSLLNVDLAYCSKGIYYAQLKKNKEVLIKKIILQ